MTGRMFRLMRMPLVGLIHKLASVSRTLPTCSFEMTPQNITLAFLRAVEKGSIVAAGCLLDAKADGDALTDVRRKLL